MESSLFYPYYYILYNFILWLVAYFYSKNNRDKQAKIGYNRNERGFLFLFILVISYSVFTFFGGDTFKYKEIIEGGFSDGYYYNYVQVEPFYLWIANLVKGNYYLWKIIIYLSAILVTHHTFKELRINNFSSWFFFVVLAMISYGSTRAVFAYSLYCYGLAIVSSEKLLKKIVGIVFLIASIFAHASMALICIMTLLVNYHFTRKKLISLLIAFPFIIIIANVAISILEENVLFLDTYMGYKFNKYLDEEGGAGTNVQALSLIIQNFLGYLLYTPILYLVIKADIKKRLPERHAYFARISFYIVYISLIIRFLDINNSEYLFIRYFTIFPFVVIPSISALFCLKGLSLKMERYLDSISLLYGFYFFTMMMYIQYANGAV